MNRPEHQASKDVVVDSEPDAVPWMISDLELKRSTVFVFWTPRSRLEVGAMVDITSS